MYLILLHVAIKIWVNIGSGDGFVPDCNNPLPETMLTNHQLGAVAILQEMPKISVLEKSLKMNALKLQLHLPGPNEWNVPFYS